MTDDDGIELRIRFDHVHGQLVLASIDSEAKAIRNERKTAAAADPAKANDPAGRPACDEDRTVDKLTVAEWRALGLLRLAERSAAEQPEGTAGVGVRHHRRGPRRHRHPLRPRPPRPRTARPRDDPRRRPAGSTTTTGPSSTAGGTRWPSSNPPGRGSDVTSPAGWPATPDCSRSSKTKTATPSTSADARARSHRRSAKPSCRATAPAPGPDAPPPPCRCTTPTTAPTAATTTSNPSSPNASSTTSSSTPNGIWITIDTNGTVHHWRPDGTEILANPTADHPGTVNALDAPARLTDRRLALGADPARDRPPTPLARRPLPPRRLHRSHPDPPRPRPPTHQPHPRRPDLNLTEDAGTRTQPREGGCGDVPRSVLRAAPHQPPTRQRTTHAQNRTERRLACPDRGAAATASTARSRTWEQGLSRRWG